MRMRRRTETKMDSRTSSIFELKMPRTSGDGMPERHGKTWLEDEEKYILNRIEKGALINIIADEVYRTTGGVYSHLKEIAYKNIKNGMMIEDASTLTSVSVSELQDFIAKKDFLQKRKESKGLIQQKLVFPLEKKDEETLLSVAIEIRDLLKQLLKND
jgi:hypothetical protein